MKKLFFTLLTFVCLKANAQQSDFHCGAGGYSTFYMEVISKEDTIRNGKSTFFLKLIAQDSSYIDTLYFTDTSGFICKVDSQFDKRLLLPGDSIYAIVSVTYDTTQLPYYPRMLSLECLGKDSAALPTRRVLETVLFFTPWNSLEIWDKEDFYELPRRWDQPDSGSVEPQRVYLPRAAVPISTSLPLDSVNSAYDLEMQMLEYVDHLPFGVLMKAPHPDSLIAWQVRDSIDFINKSNFRSAYNPHFFGKVEGRVTFNKLDDHKRPVICSLSGIKIRLVYFSAGKRKAGETTTDAFGNYSIPFDFKAYGRGVSGKVEFGLELISYNENFDVSVSRRKFNRDKFYILSEYWGGTFDNANNGTTLRHSFNLLEADKGPFQALHYAVNAYHFVKEMNNIQDMSNYLNIYLYKKDKVSSHYFPFNRTIYLEPGDDKLESVVYHEFGHHVMNVLQGGYGLKGTAFHHPWPNNLPPIKAWCEGWGYGFAQMVDLAFRDEDEESDWILAIPAGNAAGFPPKDASGESRDKDVFSNGTTGFMGEYFIACTLYDLFDGPDKFSTGNLTNVSLFNDDPNQQNGYTVGEDDVSLSFSQIAGFFKAVRNGAYPYSSNIQLFYKWLCTDLGMKGKFCEIPKIKKIFRENRICSVIGDNVYFDNVLSSDDIFLSSLTISSGNSSEVFGIDVSSINSSQSFSLNPYNTNNEEKDITDDLTVYGNLSINQSLNAAPVVVAASVYSCVFKIEAGGTLQIGDDIGYHGIGVMKIFNKIELNSGSNLIVSENSRLIIKSGGKLVIQPNAQISLNGEHALIEVEEGGVIEIADNAIFTFTGKGKLLFHAAGLYHAIRGGVNSKVVLQGSNLYNDPTDHVVLEVEGGEALYPTHLSLFSIENATVYLGNQCRLNIGAPIYLNHVRITATDETQPHRGLHLFGQEAHITACTFKFGDYGIHAMNTYFQHPLVLAGCAFKNCETGVYAYDKGIRLDACDFENCNHGINALAMSYGSWIKNSTNTLGNYDMGQTVTFKGLIGGNLSATGNSFVKNLNNAIFYKGPSLSLRCNYLYQNMECGVSGTAIHLNMSETYSKRAGRNIISENSLKNVEFGTIGALFLDHGYNNFSTANQNAGTKFFTGKSDCYINYIVNPYGGIQINGYSPIEAKFNYWDNDPSFNRPSVRMAIFNNIQNALPPTYNDNDVLTSGNVATGNTDCPPFQSYDPPTLVLNDGESDITVTSAILGITNATAAASAAMSYQYENKDYLTAIQIYKEILTSVNYNQAGAGMRNVLNLCYGKMLEAIGDAASDTVVVIQRDSAMPQVFSDIISVQDYLLSQIWDPATNEYIDTTLTPGDPIVPGISGETFIEPSQTTFPTLDAFAIHQLYKRKLELSLHKVFTYRMAEQRQTAKNLLDAIQSWTMSEDMPRVLFYQCLLNHELSLIQDTTIDKAQYDTLPPCDMPEENLTDPMLPFRTQGSTHTSSPQTDLVSIYPNPAHDQVLLQLILSQDENLSATLCDITGKEIRSLINTASISQGKYIFTIDLNQISPGMYLMKVKLGNDIQSLKLNIY